MQNFQQENGVLELGAQWLHGQDGNDVYRLAKERNLLSNPESDFGIEGSGLFYTDSGQQLNHETVNNIIEFLHEIKNEISGSELNASDEIVSAEQIFRESFKDFIESQKCPLSDNDLLWALFNWFIKFEVIDNSCDDLNDMSVLAYTEWQDCDGVNLINFEHGYQTLIDSLSNDIPKHFIQLEKPIKRIEICDQTQKVKLFIQNDENPLLVNHVIITCSIGYMQKNMDKFFGFQLPYKKMNVMKSIGFGTINKIYLFFDQPFWKSEDKGFQLIWTQKHDDFPKWVYDISGFDLVRGQPNVIVGWIGGNGAKEMEKIDSDEKIGIICANVLRLFLHEVNIENPSKVIRSKWSSDEHVCGAYSNRTIQYQKQNCDIECLSEPIFVPKYSNCLKKLIDWPLVMFAGEATDKEFYSTTHGAFRSGYREADRIVKFYHIFNNHKPNK